MKTMQYDGRVFWQCTDTSAIRHYGKDRLEIIAWHDGEVKYTNRTVSPSLNEFVKEQLEGVRV